MEPQEYLSKLNGMLVEKQGLLKDFLDLTLMQKEALSRDDFDELEILLAKKQAKMDAVDKLDRQFIEIADALKKELGIKSLDELPSKDVPGTRDLKENTSAVLDLLQRIRKVDEENTASMKSKLADMKKKMDQTNAYKKVSAAYSQPGKGIVNSFFDQKK